MCKVEIMEMRDLAIRILSADRLEDKLFFPKEITDLSPGTPLLWGEPTRPLGMGFQKHRRKDRLPSFHEHHHKDKRAVCLHRFAGHELLAVEIMAYALLAFPDSPPAFRRGVAHTLKEEQEHVRLYMAEMEKLGVKFGDLPLYRHFWSYVPFLTTPLKYVSVMSLTFEMANLDFAPLFGASFAKNGDVSAASLMERILKDELSHVSFGYRWLKRWENTANGWEVWLKNLPPRMLASRAKGAVFFEENRRMAGIPDDWIAALKGS